MADCDITLVAYRELAADPAIVDMVGPPPASPAGEWDVWIWRWRPRVHIEGTGEQGIVISRLRGWTAPNRHNTAAFPLLQVEVYADPDRDLVGQVKNDAEEKALLLCREVQRVLHVPDGGGLVWGVNPAEEKCPKGVVIVSSHAASEPDLVYVPEGDGMVRGIVTFNVVEGGILV